jgi:hypothetical protein
VRSTRARLTLDEAFLYSEAIDVTTCGRQRDKLCEELMFASTIWRASTHPS